MSDNRDYRERLVDEQSLADYFEDHLGPADEYDISYHSEGHSNETLFIAWGDADLVLRRPPPGKTAETAHDVLREYRIMDALQGTAVPVPETVLACTDPSVLGCDFYVMYRVEGDVIRDREPDRFGTPDRRQQFGEQLVDTLVEIHAVDYDGVGLGELGRPDGYIERQVERWHKQFEWALAVTARERNLPQRDRVADWLDRNVPETSPNTLVHGDYKPDNVMVSPADTPEVVSVFDWELSTLGDPRFDLGWLLLYWRHAEDAPPAVPDLSPTFMEQEGYPSRGDLVERYETQSDIEFRHGRFYRTLAVYKLAALGEMFFRRHLEGNADNPMYPTMREGVPALFERATRIIDGDEPL